MILKFNYRAENENTKIMIDETIPKFRGVANEVKSYINRMRADREWRLGRPARVQWDESILSFFVRLTYKSNGHIEFTGLYCGNAFDHVIDQDDDNNEELNVS